MNRKFIIYLILLAAVCIGGEFKVYDGINDIRISLGTPIFFLFLLWARQIKPIPASFIVASTVVLFRTVLSIVTTDTTLLLAFTDHVAVFFYYVVYGMLFHLFKTRSYYERPLFIALIGMIIENFASWSELAFKVAYFNVNLTLKTLITILIVSFFRSFFVLGFVNFTLLKEANVKKDFIKKRNEEMMLLVSDLFIEIVQLEKAMNDAEKATKACYDLYQDLIDSGEQQNARRALKIAGEVHEIKKDNQRIHAGLLKLRLKEQTTNLMSINKIVDVAVYSNKSYAYQLNKKIDFKIDIKGDHPFYNNLIVLSIINNLITNSIEAIEGEGVVSILIDRIDKCLHIKICDNGPGISPNRQELVFEPGYTTKFDSTGLASNGIGLSHIKEVIESLNGKIELNSDKQLRKTTFSIKLPIENINYCG